MGNYVSSCSYGVISPKMKSLKASRVIFPTGEVRQFREPVKAAELMLECPSFFLVDSKSLSINRRFSPLSADEDLEFGGVYIMFPMRRVNSMVTPADMAVFWMSANTAAKRISGRISPEKTDSDGVSYGGDAKEAPGGVAEQPRLTVDVPEFSYRLAACRSRKPFLDTITEEPVYSR